MLAPAGIEAKKKKKNKKTNIEQVATVAPEQKEEIKAFVFSNPTVQLS